MAEAQQAQAPTISEQYLLEGKQEKVDADTKPADVKEVENPGKTDPEEVVAGKTEEPPAVAAEDSTEVAAGGNEESSESAPSATADESTEPKTAPIENSAEAATEESSENAEDSGDQEVAEEAPEIKLETAPADFRFPTTNQTRHCFTRYIEYHRCVAAKGEGAPECDKFQKYYRSLCPGEWVYSIEDSDQCLIGTAEIPVGGIHMDSILSESSLPLKGLYRLDQFSKVEMFILCRPDESNFYHEELIRIEEDLFSSLGLHYKTLDMASGDLGAPAYRKYNIEAWMPGLERFGEISSASNCTDYQSRRLGIRYRPSEPSGGTPKKGKSNLAPPQFVHTLNATACAVPRMIVCLLENYQQEDGSVIIPEPLRPFMGGLELIAPKSR